LSQIQSGGQDHAVCGRAAATLLTPTTPNIAVKVFGINLQDLINVLYLLAAFQGCNPL